MPPVSFRIMGICRATTVITASIFLLVITGCSSMHNSEVARTAASTTPILEPRQSDDVDRLAVLWRERKAQALTDDYPIGPGDVLQINVAGMEEIKDVSQRVTGEGTISLPFVGIIHASGMTDKTLRDEIRRRLETNYMRNPQISLFVKEFRSRQVAVIGAVQKPGLYNLASSADTVFGMISQAGGMTNQAAERILFIPADPAEPEKAKEVIDSLPVQLVRQDPSPMVLKDVDPIVINLDSIQRSGNEKYLTIPARPGDILMVPGSGEVFVQGWVGRPGSYKITSGLTILGVVAAAGGASWPADTNSIKLIRTDNRGQKTSFTADLNAIQAGEQPDLPLREGDVIDISASGPKAVAYGFYRLVTDFIHVGASVPIR